MNSRWRPQRERDKKPYMILRGRKVWYRDLYVPWEPLDEEDT